MANALIKYEKLDANEFEEVFEKGYLVKDSDKQITTEESANTETIETLENTEGTETNNENI